jgi:curli biogenesis system outer membrane secretion channel CsgG
MRFVFALAAASLAMLASPSVAQVPRPPAEVAAPATVASSATRPTVKRKIAVGRFSNATRYGKALLLDNERDPLADQAADMLIARLVDSGKFFVLERSVSEAVEREQTARGIKAKSIGADALVVGSVTEFGRKVEGNAGFLNSKMRQIATATVEVRLVDVSTGEAFFSTSGHGSAVVEVGEVMGFGSRAGYDSTLNDKAISAAISDLLTNVLQKLEERRWSTDVLQVRGSQIFISGGPSQGMKVGDRYLLETRGETVVSGQSGVPIRLPGERVGQIEVVSFFGDNPSAEGAIARLLDGQPPAGDFAKLIVVESR